MSVAVISGSCGLVGSEAALWFGRLGITVLGIDNDMRSVFFGSEASTLWNRQRLQHDLGNRYRHFSTDIRNAREVDTIFSEFGQNIVVVIHTAAQPSHDWAASDPGTDFSVNANGTLNMLEATRRHCPDAAFIFTSTNKVYGDTPNRLPLYETALRWEIQAGHRYAEGINEQMAIDQSLHSIFGASKVAADLLVQEYGRYFGLKTVCFRGGCLTGPNHSGTELHGFLAYLMKCTISGRPYTVFGYKGKQVRDNIHSADLIACFYQFFLAPRVGEVYNIGGGQFSNTSMLEAIQLCEQIAGRSLQWTYSDVNRPGDHIWWITDTRKFRAHYPRWTQRYSTERILSELYHAIGERESITVSS